MSGVVLTDGAMGTELWRRGWDPSRPTALAVLEEPDTVLAIHRDYYRAGARVLLTNTFVANAGRLPGHVDVRSIQRAAVELADRASAARCRVLGDIGPLWDLLEPRGTLDEERVKTIWSQQALALIEAGVSGLLVETLSGRREIELAAEAIRSLVPNAWLATSVILRRDSEGRYLTLAGDPLSEVLAAWSAGGFDVVGFNCGELGLGDHVEAVRAARAAGLPRIWVRAGAGLTPECDPKAEAPIDPEDYALQIDDLLEAGATWFGGCCGTRPAHIEALRQALDAG
ncbi:MAG: homocysteine S-methyltransferase family protein [Planctomycetota bacterium]